MEALADTRMTQAGFQLAIFLDPERIRVKIVKKIFAFFGSHWVGDSEEAVIDAHLSVDGLFTKLPKGLSIDLSDLILDVYNRATEILAQEPCQDGGKSVVPATILGKVIFDAARAR